MPIDFGGVSDMLSWDFSCLRKYTSEQRQLDCDVGHHLSCDCTAGLCHKYVVPPLSSDVIQLTFFGFSNNLRDVSEIGAKCMTTSLFVFPRIRIGHFSSFISDFRVWEWSICRLTFETQRYLQRLFTFGLALSAVIDVIITTSICYYLRGSRTGYSRFVLPSCLLQMMTIVKSMDDVVHRLLLYTINNGVLTTFASLLAMVFVSPHEDQDRFREC